MWKGTNPKAEMYSAFKSDVEVPGADETKLNRQILDRLYSYDNIVVCGQASSHCVLNPVNDMVAYFDTVNPNKGKPPRIVLLSDGSSSIKGYEEQTKQWSQQIVKSCEYLSVLSSGQLRMIEDLK